MFKKVLIANRGEIAVRVIRACRDLGIQTVAVHSEPDAESLHCRLADEKVCIGESAPSSSYLNIPSILSAAEITKSDAIHPGYGFLAENASFAEVCASIKVAFIGPPASSIRLMGDKAQARAAAVAANVPVTPGSDGVLPDETTGLAVAKTIEFPVILKAVAGGGGRGMRVVENEEQFSVAYQTAQGEALAAFGNGDLYLERFVKFARHVEIQVFADQHGRVDHLGERDCSLQRRHQKLVEESPSPALDDDLRRRMGEAAVAVTKAAGYVGAGTVEFLLDDKKRFYFMEMNTRIQVEHPVTEELYGLDLVREQICVAAGMPLSFPPAAERKPNGHVIEFRINAEDPDREFMSSPGKITSMILPGGPGVRVDTHVYVGYTVPPYYDSLVAKLIVKAPTRNDALARAARALAEFEIEGIKTTIPFHRRIITDPNFRSGAIDTKYVERMLSQALAAARA